MKTRLFKNVKRWRAVAILETCMIMPFAVLLPLITWDYGTSVLAHHRASAVAQQVATAAVVAGGTSAVCSDGELCWLSAAEAMLENSGLAEGDVTVSGSPDCSLDQSPVTVEVTYELRMVSFDYFKSLSFGALEGMSSTLSSRGLAVAGCEVRA